MVFFDRKLPVTQQSTAIWQPISHSSKTKKVLPNNTSYGYVRRLLSTKTALAAAGIISGLGALYYYRQATPPKSIGFSGRDVLTLISGVSLAGVFLNKQIYCKTTSEKDVGHKYKNRASASSDDHFTFQETTFEQIADDTITNSDAKQLIDQSDTSKTNFLKMYDDKIENEDVDLLDNLSGTNGTTTQEKEKGLLAQADDAIEKLDISDDDHFIKNCKDFVTSDVNGIEQNDEDQKKRIQNLTSSIIDRLKKVVENGQETLDHDVDEKIAFQICNAFSKLIQIDKNAALEVAKTCFSILDLNFCYTENPEDDDFLSKIQTNKNCLKICQFVISQTMEKEYIIIRNKLVNKLSQTLEKLLQNKNYEKAFEFLCACTGCCQKSDEEFQKFISDSYARLFKSCQNSSTQDLYQNVIKYLNSLTLPLERNQLSLTMAFKDSIIDTFEFIEKTKKSYLIENKEVFNLITEAFKIFVKIDKSSAVNLALFATCVLHPNRTNWFGNYKYYNFDLVDIAKIYRLISIDESSVDLTKFKNYSKLPYKKPSNPLQETCEGIFHLALMDSKIRINLLNFSLENCSTDFSKYQADLPTLIRELDINKFDQEVLKTFFYKCMSYEDLWDKISLDVCDKLLLKM